MCGAMDKLQGNISLTSNTQMLDRLSSPRGGYHTTSKAGTKLQAPQAKAQVNPSFQGGLKAKTKPATNNRGRGRGAGKSGRGGSLWAR